MFDLYYYIVILLFERFGKKKFEKFNVYITYNVAQRHERCTRFNITSTRAKAYIILTSIN